jgi:ABC-type lipoprotein release transport system permease subunit
MSMKNNCIIFVIFVYSCLFSGNDNRSIHIVINNTNTNTNTNTNINDNSNELMHKNIEIKSLDQEEKGFFQGFVPTKKQALFFVFFLIAYYINFFKISSVLGMFIVLKNKIIRLLRGNKKNRKEEDSGVVKK